MGRLFLIVALSLIVLIFFLFFPIVLSTDSHYDLNRKKFAFSVLAYNIIPLIGGYISTYHGGLAVHFSETKATVIPYQEMDSQRKKFAFYKTFRVIGGTLTTETGAKYLLPTALAHAILRTLFFINGGEKENIENNLWLTDGDELKISLYLAVYFNLYMMICAFIKFLKEKIQIICRKKTKKSTV